MLPKILRAHLHKIKVTHAIFYPIDAPANQTALMFFRYFQNFLKSLAQFLLSFKQGNAILLLFG